MERIKLGSCIYMYEQKENNYNLYYDADDFGWVEDLRGQIAYSINDTGDGLIITQEKPNELDYGLASELKFLLNKIKYL